DSEIDADVALPHVDRRKAVALGSIGQGDQEEPADPRSEVRATEHPGELEVERVDVLGIVVPVAEGAAARRRDLRGDEPEPEPDQVVDARRPDSSGGEG